LGSSSSSRLPPSFTQALVCEHAAFRQQLLLSQPLASYWQVASLAARLQDAAEGSAVATLIGEFSRAELLYGQLAPLQDSLVEQRLGGSAMLAPITLSLLDVQQLHQATRSC
jgi:hypothetical protein